MYLAAKPKMTATPPQISELCLFRSEIELERLGFCMEEGHQLYQDCTILVSSENSGETKQTGIPFSLRSTTKRFTGVFSVLRHE
jgi:hypothetical protein